MDVKEEFITDMRGKSSHKLHDVQILLESGIKFQLEAHKANYGSYIYWLASTDKPMSPEYDNVHPFYVCNLPANNYEKTKIYDYEAGVVADNDITRCILKNLALSDKELSKKTQNNTAASYRAIMLEFLRNLWD